MSARVPRFKRCWSECAARSSSHTGSIRLSASLVREQQERAPWDDQPARPRSASASCRGATGSCVGDAAHAANLSQDGTSIRSSKGLSRTILGRQTARPSSRLASRRRTAAAVVRRLQGSPRLPNPQGGSQYESDARDNGGRAARRGRWPSPSWEFVSWAELRPWRCRLGAGRLARGWAPRGNARNRPWPGEQGAGCVRRGPLLGAVSRR